MGKMAAYLGPATQIAAVAEQGSYALMKQASDCPDGFGFGWYPADGNRQPLRIQSRYPIWSDDQHLQIVRRYTAECVLVNVRKAETLPAEISGCQPYAFGDMLFMYEGHLERFQEVYERPLRNRLKDKSYKLIRGNTESELLFATWVDALGDNLTPEGMANALEGMVSVVTDLAEPAEAPATFAVVVTDGTCLVSLRTATHGSPPSLYTIVADPTAPLPATGRVLATEPLFPGSWSSLDPHSLTIFSLEAKPGR